MKIYVAGKWSDRDYVKQIMKTLESKGHTITCDWTHHKYEDEAAPQKYCQDGVLGVITAEVYVGVFAHEYNYRGALVEFGIALGHGKPCVFLGHQQDGCIFSNHPLVVVVNTIEELVNLLEFIEKG